MQGYTQVETAVAALELEVTGGPAAGLRLSVHEDFRIGSAENGPSALGGDRWLSPSHALFHRGPDSWAVQDLRSVEGTTVNGRAVRGAAPLHPGDVVELGSSRIVVLPDAHSTVESLTASSPAGIAAGLREENRKDLDGKRVIAALLDAILVAVAIAVVSQGVSGGRLVFLVAALALGLTYYFVCESLTGQTLGKRVTGLRVVRVDGRPLAPSAVAGRTVLRLVDQQAASLVGLLTMIFTGKRRQRLGDLAAGTAVTRASTPAPRPERRGRERFAFYAYPAVWLAPAVLMFVLLPETRLAPCSEARLTTTGGAEGSCLVDNSASGEPRVFDVVNAGHELRMPGYSARLVGTRTRRAGARTVVGFKVTVRNTGDRRLRFDGRGRQIALGVQLADGRSGLVRQISPRRHSGFPTFASGGPIPHGKSRTAWARFSLPEGALPELRAPGVGLMLMPAEGASPVPHIGEIRLWRAANTAGVRALSGLAG